MATNKHAQIRYQALDRCFGNFQRRFYIEDLIKACNDAIYDYSGITDGVKRRQIYDDIVFMESDAGWSIPLERIRDGRRVFYRYEDKDFSINKRPITITEANQLKDTIIMLNRFQGLPGFEWIDEMIVRLNTQFNLVGFSNSFVSFDHNPYLEGYEFFSKIFSCIQNKRVVEINYQTYHKEHPEVFVLHPYHLKQYNNRWFLLGWNEEYESITNVALDRIVSIKELTNTYKTQEIDFQEYFDDVVGVSIPQNKEPEKIFLRIDNSLYPYIKTKPLHGSQTEKEVHDLYTLIELTVIPNYELESLLLSYGEGIEIISPKTFQNQVKVRLEESLNKYM